jgi:hypothetical protein
VDLDIGDDELIQGIGARDSTVLGIAHERKPEITHVNAPQHPIGVGEHTQGERRHEQHPQPAMGSLHEGRREQAQAGREGNSLREPEEMRLDGLRPLVSGDE